MCTFLSFHTNKVMCISAVNPSGHLFHYELPHTITHVCILMFPFHLPTELWIQFVLPITSKQPTHCFSLVGGLQAPSTITYDEDSSFDTTYAKLANMVVLKFVWIKSHQNQPQLPCDYEKQHNQLQVPVNCVAVMLSSMC